MSRYTGPMFIPFLPTADAMAILEAHYESEAMRGELEAEIGSSYFMGGLSSWEASAQARTDLDRLEAERAATPEGQLYDAQVEAARFMESAITPDMRIYDALDYADGKALRFSGANLGTALPEFIPGITRNHFLHGIDTSTEDIPF